MATQVMMEVQTLVQSIAEFETKTVFVYDEENLADRLKAVNLPAVGLIYNGMRSVTDPGPSTKMGISGEIHFTLMLLQRGEAPIRTDTKGASFLLLDSLRTAILGTRSVTGHFYHFQMEAPAALKGGLIFWAQRWSVPVQNRPNR
jgi:hypothetical protein